MQDNFRLIEISYMRVMAMLMVVLFHSYFLYTGVWPFDSRQIQVYDVFCQVLNRIDMYIFAFISGYLYFVLRYVKGNYSDTRIFLKNKTLRLVVPYLFWGIVQMLIFGIGWSFLLDGAAHLWFLQMMFWIFLMVRGAEKVILLSETKWYVDICLVIMPTVIFGILKTIEFDKTILSVVRTANYLPCFLFGSFFAKYRVAERLMQRKTYLYVGGGIFSSPYSRI